MAEATSTVSATTPATHIQQASSIAIEESARLDNNAEDADSAYDSELASYTTSLASAVTDYKNLHGRRYHAHKEGSYVFPNDEQESDRMDIAHKMCEIAMDGKLFLAPLEAAGTPPPKRVLDLGTGTGIWAMEMGDRFPNADVLGNDLSPIQPRWVPPNVRFEVDDFEAEWTYATHFDFIHARNLYSAVVDWPRLMRQTYDHLQPGCYAEFVDMDATWTSPDNSITDSSVLRIVGNKFSELSRRSGREPNPGPLLEGWMREAGFVDVYSRRMALPMGTWPADKALKEAGAWNWLQFNEGMEGFITYSFVASGEYTKEECDVIAAQCRAEAKNPKVHAMYWLYAAYGRKPGGDGDAETTDPVPKPETKTETKPAAKA